ncbi:unnamed protein product [Lactuca virosa]|uniref:CTP synthase N-terminal domain-containing protein n=1 Tax=Lactuca virosa TaxID=75947 RepID=A0AAU9PNJ4_9ASTR|nr:unnamed protein product [Lactuca virosa]
MKKLKTKPTHHSVRELRALGLTPHFLACRSAQPLLENTKQKLSQFCHVPAANILNIHDVPNICHVPLLLRNQNAHEAILKQLALLRGLTGQKLFDNLTNSVKIAMVGKYVGLTDSYLSVVKALLHACIAYIDQMPLVSAKSKSEPSKPSLTPEERKAKAQELNEKAKRKRRKKREWKEKERRKRMEEENERKRIIALRKAEKEEERRAREKIRQKLEEDKAERRRKLGLPAEDLTATKPSAPIVEEKKN